MVYQNIFSFPSSWYITQLILLSFQPAKHVLKISHLTTSYHTGTLLSLTDGAKMKLFF